MPFRVGIDLVSVEAVGESVRAHGARYLERIFTRRELDDCSGDLQRLAARFAAKEAALKVLRTTDEGVPWNAIELVRNAGGWVDISLTGRAERVASEAGLSGFAVSVTHEGGHASAVVLAEVERAA